MPYRIANDRISVVAGAGTTKQRKKRYTGDATQYKAWLREMDAGPGIFIPMRTYSEANMRSHFYEKSNRTKTQRGNVYCAMYIKKPMKTLPATVRLTRYGVNLLDDDNIRGALKAVRDEIAHYFGVDDSPTSPLKFEYAQQREKHYGIRIEIRGS